MRVGGMCSACKPEIVERSVVALRDRLTRGDEFVEPPELREHDRRVGSLIRPVRAEARVESGEERSLALSR